MGHRGHPAVLRVVHWILHRLVHWWAIHGTSGSSGHPGTGSGSSGSVGQQARAPSSDDEEFFDVPPPQIEADSRRRKPKWLQDTLKEAETVGAPKKSVRESKSPERFGKYIAMVTDIIEAESSSYEEASTQSVWRESMMEEYASIMKNDVWGLCLDLRVNLWLFPGGCTRLNMLQMAVSKSIKRDLWLEDSHR